MKLITDRPTAKQYFFKFFLICTALFALYLLVAWSTYSPWDNSWSTSSSSAQIYNKSGGLGAWLMDLLFVSFGYVSNFIPFSLLLLSLYFLLRKTQGSFAFWRLMLRLVGLVCFVAGCCVWITMLFAHHPYYPAGGVLGALLVHHFFPVLDFVGLMLISVMLSLGGFLLFTGLGFIHLMIDCFYWLTMKTKAEPEAELEAEPISPAMSAEQGELVLTTASEQVSTIPTSEKPTLVDIGKFINIQGLPEETEKTASEPQNISEKAYPFASDLDERDLPTVAMPEQSAVQNAEISHRTLTDNAHLNADNPFSPVRLRPETPSVAEVPQQAKPFENAENDDWNALTANAETETDEEKETSAVETRPDDASGVVYKPYAQTLIHPALQPTTTAVEKPTTPLPSLDLLDHRTTQTRRITEEEIIETSQRIEQQLRNFNVKAEVKDVLVGPVVTRYELELQPGVKAARVTSIDTDLARALMFRTIRVAEVIPDKPYIGIETPNVQRQIVSLREVLDSDAFRNSKALLPMALGKDISGQPIVVDLAKMPHLLVAGSTGSGKSVGINTMILSLLYRVKPEEVKFIMIDPKVVELSIYDGIPHLLTNVVTDMKKAANALRWCVDEMERRYQLLSALRVRNIEGYNEKIAEYEAINMPIPNPLWRPGDTMDALPPPLQKLNYIVVIVDEFADLMMVAGKQVEELIARLAQKARAIGIHLILATQRPSVDVITGLIKANVPSRIAFTVASKIDSRTILDQGGAETLLGRGDMLYSPQGSSELMRVHGAFMSDDEVARVVDDWKARGKPEYIEGILEGDDDNEEEGGSVTNSDELDDLFDEVANFVINTGNTSTSYVQRKFKVGFNRAARIMDQLEEQGIIAVHNGKREVVARNSNDY